MSFFVVQAAQQQFVAAGTIVVGSTIASSAAAGAPSVAVFGAVSETLPVSDTDAAGYCLVAMIDGVGHATNESGYDSTPADACAEFNGSSSFLSLDCSSDDPFTGLSSWTAVVRLLSPNPGPGTPLWSAGRSVAVDDEISISIIAGRQLLVSTNTSTGTYQWSIGSALFPEDDSHHIVVLRMDSGALRCFVDGTEPAVTTTPGTGTYEPIGDANADWNIGWTDAIGYSTNPCISRNVFYGTALSAATCLAISGGTAPAPSGSIYNLPLVGNANDVSGNGRDFVSTDVVYTGAAGHAWEPGSDMRTRFCSFVPAMASAFQPFLWRPVIAEWPDILEERSGPLGGSTEGGGFTLSLLDDQNYLTQQLRTERDALTSIVGDYDSSWVGGTLVLESTTGLAEEDLIWIGAECLRISSVTNGTDLEVTRGELETDSTVPHQDGDAVYLGTPILETRRVQLYTCSMDDPDASLSLVGSYAIENLDFDDPLNVWKLNCVSQRAATARVIPFASRSLTIERVDPGAADGVGWISLQPDLAGQPPLADVSRSYRQWTGTEQPAGDPLFFLQIGKEVVSVATDQAISNAVVLSARDVIRSGQETLKPGQKASLVFVAHPEYSSFRYSPNSAGPSTVRSSGTWVRTNHWVDLILCMLTSSHDPADGLELTNFAIGQANYSSLPSGYGVGFRADQIDWDSWMAAKPHTLDAVFPNFVLGGRPPEPFGELIDREFLKPIGAYLSVADDVARIVLPRAPAQGAATVTIGNSSLLTRQVGPKSSLPRIKISRALAANACEVVYLLGPNGVRHAYSNASFRDTYGQRGLFADTGRPAEIPVPGADPDHGGVYSKRSMSRLFRAHRPPFSVDVDTAVDSDLRSLAVGDLVSITVDEAPNMRDSTRGWTAQQSQVLQRREKWDGKAGGAADGASLQFGLMTYGPGTRIGRITPAAHVLSVAVGGPYYAATTTANRFTQADAVDGLPTTDATAFVVGDVCQLCDAAGVLLDSGNTQTVNATPAGDLLTLDGDFGGAMVAGTTVIYAGVDDGASVTQRARFAFYAARSTRSVGASDDQLWDYGEA